MSERNIYIIYSPGYGAGWSTWGDTFSCLDQELAVAILNNSPDINSIAEKNWPGQYQGGLSDCVVTTVPKGTRFRINEYDGNESLEIESEPSWLIAM